MMGFSKRKALFSRHLDIHLVIYLYIISSINVSLRVLNPRIFSVSVLQITHAVRTELRVV